MLDFMIISLPRSGSTWATNWLTGAATYCHHDPLWTMHYSEFDRVVPAAAGNRIAGIACTGIWMWPDWVNNHRSRKLVLHRDPAEVNQSLHKIGYPELPSNAQQRLNQLDGYHVPYTALFDPKHAPRLWNWVTNGRPFDEARHAQLVQMKIEPNLDAVQRDLKLNHRLGLELA